VKNAKYRLLRRPRSFKLIEIGTNRKPVCDILLVINTDILSRTVSELSQFIVQILDTDFAFLNPPLGNLGTTYDVHLGIIGKRVVDFLLVYMYIELFSLGVTAESLRAN